MVIRKVLTSINCAIPKLDLAAQSDFPAHFQGLSGVRDLFLNLALTPLFQQIINKVFGKHDSYCGEKPGLQRERVKIWNTDRNT